MMTPSTHRRDCDWKGSYNPTTGRAEIDVKVLGHNGTDWKMVGVIVDSGADYFQMSSAGATAIGLPAGTPHTVTTAGGATTHMTLVRGQQVEVEGRVIIQVDILVDPTNLALPLFGRQAMQQLRECGFGAADWGTKD
jgi:predicted aspartyl protease